MSGAHKCVKSLFRCRPTCFLPVSVYLAVLGSPGMARSSEALSFLRIGNSGVWTCLELLEKELHSQREWKGLFMLPVSAHADGSLDCHRKLLKLILPQRHCFKFPKVITAGQLPSPAGCQPLRENSPLSGRTLTQGRPLWGWLDGSPGKGTCCQGW